MISKNQLKFLHINCRSISNPQKSIQIENLVQKHEIDIFSINETFLKPNKKLEFRDYYFLCADRLVKRGGGSLSE